MGCGLVPSDAKAASVIVDVHAAIPSSIKNRQLATNNHKQTTQNMHMLLDAQAVLGDYQSIAAEVEKLQAAALGSVDLATSSTKPNRKGKGTTNGKGFGSPAAASKKEGGDRKSERDAGDRDDGVTLPALPDLSETVKLMTEKESLLGALRGELHDNTAKLANREEELADSQNKVDGGMVHNCSSNGGGHTAGLLLVSVAGCCAGCATVMWLVLSCKCIQQYIILFCCPRGCCHDCLSTWLVPCFTCSSIPQHAVSVILGSGVGSCTEDSEV